MAIEDKLAVVDVVQTERAARDQGQWGRMAACYHPDSRVSISWIETSGPEFVAASERAFASGLRHLHQMGPTLVTLDGDRALAETGCAILLGGAIDGAEVVVTSQARLHARVERRDDRVWRIAMLQAVYFEDAISSRIPGEVPRIDQTRLAGYRHSLRFLSYLLVESGKTPRPDLAGIDRPDLVEALWAADQAWLAGG
jgi:hypothetical protein